MRLQLFYQADGTVVATRHNQSGEYGDVTDEDRTRYRDQNLQQTVTEDPAILEFLNRAPARRLLVLDTKEVVILEKPPTALLKEAKAQQIAAIDKKTDAVMSAGFLFQGQYFSLSIEAQMKYAGADAHRDEMMYPIVWNTKDDNGVFTATDASELHGFVLSALVRVREILDGGTSLKNRVRAARTMEEVQDIVDTRA